MDVRVIRPPPMPNTVGTTAHREGDRAQDHGVLLTGTEEPADKRDNDTSNRWFRSDYNSLHASLEGNYK